MFPRKTNNYRLKPTWINRTQYETFKNNSIILAAVTLVIDIAFLCLSIKKVIAGHANWSGGIWIFGLLAIFISILIILAARPLQKNGK